MMMIIIIIYSLLAVFSAVSLSIKLTFGHYELSVYLAMYVRLQTHLNKYEIKRRKFCTE
jgi:hypothetical protein